METIRRKEVFTRWEILLDIVSYKVNCFAEM